MGYWRNLMRAALGAPPRAMAGYEAAATSRRTLGWNPAEGVMKLQDTDFGNKLVQITVAFEQYQGKQQVKVKWIDEENATGGVPKADADTRSQISAKMDSALRAMSTPTAAAEGPKPAPTRKRTPVPAAGNAPATPTPAAPPPPPPPPPAPATPPKTATEDEAWKAFNAACPPDMPEEKRRSEWFRIIAEMFGDEKPGPTDWARFIDEAPGKIIPF